MTLKAPHIAGLALTGTAVLGAIGSGLQWFSTHVTVTGSTVCADGIPASAVGAVTAALTIAGAIVLLRAPSVVPAVNVRAVEDARQANVSAMFPPVGK